VSPRREGIVSEQPPWDPWQRQGQPQYPPQQPYDQQPYGQHAYPPGQQAYGPQDPGQYQGELRIRRTGQQPSRPSFAPNPQYGAPPAQPLYQGQPQYPPGSYGQQPYPPPYGQQPYPPQGHHRHSGQAGSRKKRRVFLWVFLAVQALFIAWIIVGVATVHTGPTQAQLTQGCYNHNWYPLFKSQADCVQHYGGALRDAGNAGKAIGVGIIIAFWVAVDVILGISYGIYRLARRSR